MEGYTEQSRAEQKIVMMNDEREKRGKEKIDSNLKMWSDIDVTEI